MNTLDNSWIKLPRNFVNWSWYHDASMVQLYLYLLLNANIYDTKFKDIIIKRGECLISINALHRETGITLKKLRICLQKLLRTKDILYKKLIYGRIIVLLDFNSFQPAGVDEYAPDWIKLYRKICDWGWFQDANMVHLYVFFMLKARLVTDGRTQEVKWQLCSSLRLLNKATGISMQSIRTCLARMQKTGEIEYLPGVTHKQSVITLCNYDSYQATKSMLGTSRAQDGHELGTSRAQDGQELGISWATLKEYKEYKEYKEIKNSSSRARARDFDFVENSQEGEVRKENEQKKARKESFYDLLKDNESWLMAIAKKFHLESSRQVVSKLEDFQLDLVCRGRDEHKSLQDCMEHFNDWLEISLKKGKKETAPRSPYAPNSPFAQKERWVGEYYVPKSSEGGIYEGKI